MPRLVVGLGGSVRGVATDKIPWREMFPGHCPPRASHVEVIDLGAIKKGLEDQLEHTRLSIKQAENLPALSKTAAEAWVKHNYPILLAQKEEDCLKAIDEVNRCKQNTMYFVDFSPLAAITGNPFYCCCLARTFTRREDALKAEVAWLAENYVNQEAGPSKPTGWAKAINLNVCNNKLPKPAGANPPVGGTVESLPTGS